MRIYLRDFKPCEGGAVSRYVDEGAGFAASLVKSSSGYELLGEVDSPLDGGAFYWDMFGTGLPTPRPAAVPAWKLRVLFCDQDMAGERAHFDVPAAFIDAVRSIKDRESELESLLLEAEERGETIAELEARAGMDVWAAAELEAVNGHYHILHR